uniref:Uncharacterized protein n=1 Tax=Oryza punctata TaxID=4537 RepID=A0A0E0L775_ORYPU
MRSRDDPTAGIPPVGPTETGQWRSMWARTTGCSRSPPSRAPRIYLTGLLVGEDAAYRRRKRRRRRGRGEKKKLAKKKKIAAAGFERRRRSWGLGGPAIEPTNSRFFKVMIGIEPW